MCVPVHGGGVGGVVLTWRSPLFPAGQLLQRTFADSPFSYVNHSSVLLRGAEEGPAVKGPCPSLGRHSRGNTSQQGPSGLSSDPVSLNGVRADPDSMFRRVCVRVRVCMRWSVGLGSRVTKVHSITGERLPPGATPAPSSPHPPRQSEPCFRKGLPYSALQPLSRCFF